MANIISTYFNNVFNGFGDWLGQRIAPYINDQMGQGYNILGHYYSGNQRKQLRTKIDPVTGSVTDDNITMNFIGLAVDRSVSRLYRGGIKFKLPEGSTAQQEYLDTVWDLNKKEIILYQAGLHGAVYGTPYFKIQPEELIDPYTGKEYPRLVAIDPEVIRIKTDPQDMNEVEMYVIQYKIGQVSYWEITVRSDVTYGFDSAGNVVGQYKNPNEETSDNAVTWLVDYWEQSGSQRQKVDSQAWPYDFPPIIHWKNLPSLKSCYGDSDIDDAINVQDKANFVMSNTGKIIKFHAHPETIGTGLTLSEMQAVPTMPGSFHAIPNKDAKVFNLEMQSDLASSRSFALDMRQGVFDISREVDISSMADKLGALTNFGLQILWSDAIDKNDTKRQLYGDALKELNRRLLVLAGNAAEASNPGEIQWGNPLPVNITEEITTDEKALNLGIVDKETVAQRWFMRYGKSWEDIQKALADEQAKANQNNGDIGAQILRNFNQGQGFNQARGTALQVQGTASARIAQANATPPTR